jgi:hypothetical protein
MACSPLLHCRVQMAGSGARAHGCGSTWWTHQGLVRYVECWCGSEAQNQTAWAPWAPWAYKVWRLIQWDLFDVGCCWSFSTYVPRIFYNFWMVWWFDYVWLVWLVWWPHGMLGQFLCFQVLYLLLVGHNPFNQALKQSTQEAQDQDTGRNEEPIGTPNGRQGHNFQVSARHSFGISINQFQDFSLVWIL